MCQIILGIFMLTIIIPVFNEINTIEKIINKVLAEKFILKEPII